MILKRFYDEKLAQASYLIGCQGTGEALVLDPSRAVDDYIRAAAAEGLRITAVTETHIHADYLSGSRELAHRTGATLYLSDEGDENWKYAFDGQRVKDGDTIWIGKIKLEVLHTPGHTPEHISFLLTDTPAGGEPMGMFTGDFVFVGDVGRPDLLERAAGYQGTMEAGARRLFQSLQKLKDYPDHLQIWPAHGAGSACGKGLGAVPSTTLGYERRTNWALKIAQEEEFVEAVLSGQPEPPVYFAQMKKLNKLGPAFLSERPTPQLLPASRIQNVQGMVLDLRSQESYAIRSVPGSLSIPLNKGFATWAGWLVPYDTDLYLITDDVETARRDLSSIGLDRVMGWFTPADAETVARPTPPRMSAEDFRKAHAAGEVAVLDVRSQAEWDSGHIAGAYHIPLGYLQRRKSELEGEKRTLAVHCRSGARSSMAVSLLRKLGFENVVDVGALSELGMPLETKRQLTPV